MFKMMKNQRGVLLKCTETAAIPFYEKTGRMRFRHAPGFFIGYVYSELEKTAGMFARAGPPAELLTA